MTVRTKKLWIGIGILLMLTPLGVILPRLFGAQGAWGEWGLEEIKRLTGSVPKGMKRLTELWRAPMSDYSLPGQGTGLFGESIGYVLTGIIGVALTAGMMYVLTKVLTKKKDS
jgi:cobalt/nickel transport protein